MVKSVQFWLGDWLNYGEGKYGEKYSQALDQTDYQYQTSDYKWVSNKIKVTLRIEMYLCKYNLPYKIYEVVAPLEPKEQKKWLDIAEKVPLELSKCIPNY